MDYRCCTYFSAFLLGMTWYLVGSSIRRKGEGVGADEPLSYFKEAIETAEAKDKHNMLTKVFRCEKLKKINIGVLENGGSQNISLMMGEGESSRKEGFIRDSKE